jgi:mRNA interferase HigB
MRVIAKRTLRQFWTNNPRHADARGPLEAWHAEASRASWTSPAEVKAQYRNASILKGGRIVFNIGGNKYRLVVKIRYVSHTIYILFVGTHKQYDAINVEEI